MAFACAPKPSFTAIFALSKIIRFGVPPEFLDWLSRQERKPKELVALLERALEVGFDAVMCSEVTQMTPTATATEEIPVSPVDLSAYDGLYNIGGEASV